uniref:Cyclin N-terminal domain-containing protein n=3 Tax=Ascarididae TaxID=6250 RepID=A0A914S340_PAREQ
MVAAKYEEIYPPPLKEYVYITDDTYSASQVLRMERVILSAINFDVSAPTSNWFGSRLMRIAHSQKRTVNAMNYLLELALLDHTYLKYRASV